MPLNVLTHLLVFVPVVAPGAQVHLVFVIPVLPAFNVTLTPRKPFLSIYDSELAVEISARLSSHTLYTPYFRLRSSSGGEPAFSFIMIIIIRRLKTLNYVYCMTI